LELEKTITRCLRKDLERRIQHMDDVKLALEELKEESDSGRLPSGVVPVTRSVRRWAPLAIVAGLLLVGGLAAGLWWNARTGEPVPGLVLTRLTSDSGLATDPILSPDGKLLAYASDRSGEGNLDGEHSIPGD